LITEQIQILNYKFRFHEEKLGTH